MKELRIITVLRYVIKVYIIALYTYTLYMIKEENNVNIRRRINYRYS